ncbi:MAG: hypothetical protein KGL10_04730 [Alphaproteobacteria bacterium]|nr:hypothetical protein [Alphaproteobacteria bacterium]
MIAVPALAQSQDGGMPAGGPAMQQGAQDQQQIFQQRKADILARLNKVVSCIQAANDQQALIACLPHRPAQGQGGPGMMQGGENMQQNAAPNAQ